MRDTSEVVWSDMAKRMTTEQLKQSLGNSPCDFSLLDPKTRQLSTLDFGCGLGPNFDRLRSFSYRVDGYDLPDMLNRCRPHLRYDNVYDNINNIPCKTYDLIVATFVLQCMFNSEYVVDTLSRLARLAPNLYIVSRCYTEGWSNVLNLITSSGSFNIKATSHSQRILRKQVAPSQLNFDVLLSSKYFPNRTKDVNFFLRKKWCVGITTTHRTVSTLKDTIQSLNNAGWEDLHIFSDAFDTQVPGQTIRQERAGCLGNFLLSLWEMYIKYPADYYVLCQDDIVVSKELKSYLEATMPDDGIISCYKSGRYISSRTKFQTKFEQDYSRFYDGSKFVGALFLVFPRQVLEQLLSKPDILDRIHAGTNGSDKYIGAWCQSNRVPLYIHNPSLIQHTGSTSTIGHDTELDSLDYVENTDQINQTGNPRIGIVGFNTMSGLGYLNNDFVNNVTVDKWLVIQHREFVTLPANENTETRFAPAVPSKEEIDWLLDSIDVLVFAESPVQFGGVELIREAQVRGIKVVCIPMLEWFDDERNRSGFGNWSQFVDEYLCPTRLCYDTISECQPHASIIYCPWPVNSERITFRQRTKCEKFVFVYGTGGIKDRKGGRVVKVVAESLPHIPFIVYHQNNLKHSQRYDPLYHVDSWPKNVEVRGMQNSSNELYMDGDVCVQPSAFEGLGLQLLECQMAGMPLVTTDGPPMNEYQPLRTIKCHKSTLDTVRKIDVYHADVDHAKQVVENLYGSDISEASLKARSFAKSRKWDLINTTLRKINE